MDISEHIVEIKESIARIEEDVKYHIIRTDLLEEKVETLKSRSHKWEGALLTLGVLGTILGIITAVKSLWLNV